MKKLSIKKGVQCMACLECVRACSNAYYKEFHPDKAALKIVQRGENGTKLRSCDRIKKLQQRNENFGDATKRTESGRTSRNVKNIHKKFT